MGRPSSGITKQQIVAAAIEIADADGLPAVSMRAVAHRLSVSPMSLYSRVANKDELLDGMVDELIVRVEMPPGDLPWGQRLTRLLSALRKAGQRHPTLSLLLLERPVVARTGHVVTEALFTILRSANLNDDGVLQFEQLISTWLLGFMASEARGRFGPGPTPVTQRLATLPPEEFPEHHRLAEPLQSRDWDQEFVRSTETFKEAIAAVRAAPGSRELESSTG